MILMSRQLSYQLVSTNRLIIYSNDIILISVPVVMSAHGLFSSEINRIFMIFLEGLLLNQTSIYPSVIREVTYSIMSEVSSSLITISNTCLMSSLLNNLAKVDLNSDRKIVSTE